MKRISNLYPVLISDENLSHAIEEVNKTHRFAHGRPSETALWVDVTKSERIVELREIIERGFEPKEPRELRRYDYSAGKWRDIREPALWPDQYIHHAVIQALQPVMMRGMDYWCCGSIRGRGTQRGIRGIRRWMRSDPKNTKYCAELDIHHFYDSISTEVVMDRMGALIKDARMMDVIRRLVGGGIMIGAYYSQWFANTLLQPLDHLIREKLHVRYYVRYMDNLTLFGRNKHDLHKVVRAINAWLRARDMQLKGNWQVFRTGFSRPVLARRSAWTDRRRQRHFPRIPNAMGYRFGGDFVLLRKKSLLRTKRQIHRACLRLARHRSVEFRMAAGLLSRLGQFNHCNCHRIRRRYVPKGLCKRLKRVVRKEMRARRENRECLVNTCLERIRNKVGSATSCA